MLGQDGQLVEVALGLLARDHGGELAVDLEVGIAADRRGEVAVVLARQGVMAFGLGGVVRLLEAPQEAVMDGVRLGLVGGLGEHALKLEPALGLVDLEPEAPGELGELQELARLGVGVAAAQEADVLLGRGTSPPPRWPRA